jgi:hypothetical protein
MKPFTFTRARSFGGRYARQFLASGNPEEVKPTCGLERRADTAGSPANPEGKSVTPESVNRASGNVDGGNIGKLNSTEPTTGPLANSIKEKP